MSELEEIENIMMSETIDSIPKSKINEWKLSGDSEILGAVTDLMLEPKYYKKIKPSLEFSDYYPFLLEYYLACMKENKRGEWSHSAYEAAYELRNFIEGIWSDEQLQDKDKVRTKKEIKDTLEKVSASASGAFKEVIINGLLEHLFDNSEIRRYFKDWSNIESMRSYYLCAIDKSRALE